MRVRAHNLATIYLLTLALLFNAVAPVLAYAGSADSASNKVLLCTSQGYQWVMLDEQIDQNSTAPQTSAKHCVLCIGGDNVADSSLLISVDFNQVFFSQHPLSLIDQYPHLQSLFIAQLAHSRAPPQIS